MKLSLIIVIFLMAVTSIKAQEKNAWSIEMNGGVPFNLTTPLTIVQEGNPNINLNAQYYSEPFKMPIYWVIRLSKLKKNKLWEIELKHQKLYLENPSQEIQYFNITHGFNQLLLNRGFNINIKNTPFVYRIGLGAVIAHSENMIRGKELPQGDSYFDGYFLSGPAFGTSLSKQFKFSKHVYLNTEVKYSLCNANVPIVDGYAIVWHSAVEFIFGLGYRFTKK